MIRAVVSDLGNVLVTFDPKAYLASFPYSAVVKGRLLADVFASDGWHEYDRGIIVHAADLARLLSRRHPDLGSEIQEILSPDWVKMHEVKEDTLAFYQQLKQEGYRLYFLSNISVDSLAYLRGQDFFALADGGVFSCDVHLCKPDELIYKLLLKRYGLKAEECVFIDDSVKNCLAAANLGFAAIPYLDIGEVRQRFRQLAAIEAADGTMLE